VTGTALIIGASSGIGAALAGVLAGDGFDVALVARRKDKLDEVVQRCNEIAGRDATRAYVHDVRNHDEVTVLFERIVQDLGGLDTFVYAAGVLPDIGPDEFDADKDRLILDVSLMGAVAWLDAVAVKFKTQRFGTICGISSIAGDRGRRAYPAYHAAKAGFDTFLESLRNRLYPYKVSVVTIRPGFIDTAMTQGKEGLFWVISADRAARIIAKHIRKRHGIRYVPARWMAVALVIRNIPSFIFRRMDI